ncbi:phytoene desaturase family protein [Carboxylicivirga sp. N1Y90]|uniref:phytoene desaturase family protein n=1 Tax=Carboxylicivirga fragile TaxID=3417571 RepID=UPI003D34BB9F|nr:NAD(P)/FAD-dependent oxidoreductase [Marinilabiliaceae bacterium N1Y90]
METQSKYDIVIVGSGLGGLACGSILSQRGYSVCVLEQHHQIGGCLQDFKRKGKLFDTGMHYIGSYDDGQILNTLFRYFAIYKDVDAEKLDLHAFDVLNVNNKEFSIPQGIKQFKEKLIESFPNEKDGIKTYINKLKEIFSSVDIINLRDVNVFELAGKKGLDENVFEFVSSITSDIDLQNILCYTNSLYAGKKKSASLFIHAVISIFYLQSAYKLKHGGGQIANAFKKVIENNGGRVLTQAKVEGLICDKDRIEEVKVKGQNSIQAKIVISNIDPLTTMEMTTGGNFRKVYLSRLKRQEQTISCFSLYVVFKEKSVKYINSNLYYYNDKDVWGIDNYSEQTWPQGFMLYMKESKEHKGYAESMIVLSPMEYNEMAPWFDTEIEKRGDDYKKMKAQKSDQLINLIEKKFPSIRKDIANTYSSTPLSYRDYTGVREGAMYGVSVDNRNPFESQIQPRTRVKNLFLTGQNINMHGILGVSIGAILTCGEIEGINNIMADLRKHKQTT